MNTILNGRIMKVILIGSIVVLFYCLSPTQAQDRGDLVERPRGFVGNEDWTNNDYFDTYQNPRLKSLLNNVEKNHMGTTLVGFWKAFNSKDYELARQALSYTLWVFPNHPEALQLLGAIARLTQTSSLPIPYYQKAIRLFPQHALTHAQYGAYLVSIDHIEVGIGQLKNAIEIDPNSILAHVSLEKVYSKTGNLELAREAAERVRQLRLKGQRKGGGE